MHVKFLLSQEAYNGSPQISTPPVNFVPEPIKMMKSQNDAGAFCTVTVLNTRGKLNINSFGAE